MFSHYYIITLKNNFTKEKERMNMYGHISYMDIIIHVYEYLFMCMFIHIYV